MAKITKDFYKQMAEKMPKTKTIQVTISTGDSFDIELKNYLTAEERADFVNGLLSLIKKDAEEGAGLNEAVVSIHLYETFTDIEFPESMKEKGEQLAWLIESGILEEVSNNFRQGLMEDALNYANAILETVLDSQELEITDK